MTETSKSRWWRNPDKGYVFWQVMLIAAITASCGFNGAHAALGATGGVGRVIAAVFGAVIPPLFFFAIAEGVLMIWHRELSRIGTVILGTLVLAAGAAAGARSFFGLVDFSSRFDVLPADHKVWLVYMLPLVTDALALGATVALFNLKGSPVRKKKPKERRVEQNIATIGLIPKLKIRLFGGAATVPTVPTTPRRQPIDTPPPTAERQSDDSLTTPEPVANSLSPTAATTPTVVAEDVVGSGSVIDIDADSLAFATEVRARAKVQSPPETVHRAIESLRATGGNLSAARKAAGIKSRDPVRSIAAALAEMDGEEPARALTAVG
ncbi:hypothetical protein [Mycobacteroides abscessus]|uniref:hypothetical protein n=1 Tax=Mycobacteroides abscessus TaxID=36809 RepID=UPI000C25DD38|nr:hypothetical protein [Mycobacteroides abscessus]